jgi:uncharacterized protein YndB with AHSA1/START domain
VAITDRTEKGQTGSIAFEFDLDHPPEKVWRALTDPALVSEWLLPVARLELEPDAAFALQAPPQPGWDGTVDCRFVEVEAQRRVSYTWSVGDPESDFFLDTVVTFTLTPTASGTLLSLVQSGFEPDQKQNFGGARYGWRMMGGRLVNLLARIESAGRSS